MPVYDYECPWCGEQFEMIVPVKEYDCIQQCPKCGSTSERIITSGHGGIQCDSQTDVKWLPSACKNLLPDGHKPIETRGEYRRYLKEHGVLERA